MSGVPVQVPSLPNVTPTSGDSIPVWDTETGIQGRTTIAALNALWAQLAATNTFTASQIIQGNLSLQVYDAGLGGVGRSIVIDRSSNASEPAPGAATFRTPGGSAFSIYVDDGGLLRIRSGGGPTSAQVAAGTVVGSQSSPLDAKDEIGEAASLEVVLGAIFEGAAAVRAFQYKSPVWEGETGELVTGERPYSGEVFEGVILDYAPRYGMDRDETHPQGKSLNTITITGDLLRAVDWLVQRNADLESRLLALEGGASGG